MIRIKRIFDLTTAIILLIVFFIPIIFLMILVKISSKGPIFYKWNVIGKEGKPFTSYKFRTMINNAENMKKQIIQENEMTGPVFKMKEDPRITTLGKYFRKYSLDELPQLWSVLKGDMSLVGPRPPLQTEWIDFEEWQKRKVSVKPGITCTWQVNGRNEVSDFNDWVKMDLDYIDNWTFLMDIKILVKTIPAVLSGSGH